MSNYFKYILIIVFVSSLLFLGFKTTLKEPSTFSYLENRNLNQKPELSLTSFVSGEYSNKFNFYFEDQFYNRLEISKLFYQSQLLLNKNVIENVLIGENGWLADTSNDNLDIEEIDTSISEINNLYAYASESNIPLYFVLNPSKDITLSHLFPYHPDFSQKIDIKNTFIEKFNTEIPLIDTSSYFEKTFTQNDLESFFYKTDLHWNYKGGYYAYQHLLNTLNSLHPDIPSALKQDELIERCLEPNKAYFLGAQNRYLLKSVTAENESLCTYSLKANNLFSEVYAVDHTGHTLNFFDEIYQTSLNSYEQNYGGLFNHDLAELVHINKNAPNDIRALIIKDSYTNAMQPFIATHFKETRILDMRYYKEMSVIDYIKKHDINFIILSHNDSYLIGETLNYSLSRDNN